MIGQREALRLPGCAVVDPHGHRLGIVGQVFLDELTEQPEWVTVETGLYGTNESFVPLAGATFDDGTLTVAVPKDTVRLVPRVVLDQGDLPSEQVRALYGYYGSCSGITPTGREEDDDYAAAVRLSLRERDTPPT